MDTQLKGIMKSPRASSRMTTSGTNNVASSLKKKRKAAGSSSVRRKDHSFTVMEVSTKKKRKKPIQEVEHDGLSSDMMAPYIDTEPVQYESIDTSSITRNLDSHFNNNFNPILPNGSSIIEEPVRELSFPRVSQTHNLNSSALSNVITSVVTPDTSGTRLSFDTINPDSTDTNLIEITNTFNNQNQENYLFSQKQKVDYWSKNKIFYSLLFAFVAIIIARYNLSKSNNIPTNKKINTSKLSETYANLQILLKEQPNNSITELSDLISIELNNRLKVDEANLVIDQASEQLDKVTVEVKQLISEMSNIPSLAIAQADSLANYIKDAENIKADIVKVNILIEELDNKVSRVLSETIETTNSLDELIKLQPQIEQNITIFTNIENITDLDTFSKEISHDFDKLENMIVDVESILNSTKINGTGRTSGGLVERILKHSREASHNMLNNFKKNETNEVTTLVNYSLLSKGAHVKSTDMIPSHNLWILFQQGRVTSNLNILLNDVESDDMYCFRGTTGSVTIDLGRYVHIKQIKFPLLKHKGYLTSYPSKIQVIAQTDSSIIDLGIFTTSLIDNTSNIFTINDINTETSLPLPMIRNIEIKILSNHGNKNRTCLTKILVYSTPDTIIE